MIESISKSNLINKLSGILLILLSAYQIYRHLTIVYDYKSGGILNNMIIPNWVLVIECIIGFGGIMFGLLVFNGSLKMKKGVAIAIILWISGLVVLESAALM